jgi:hypothetical protein
VLRAPRVFSRRTFPSRHFPFARNLRPGPPANRRQSHQPAPRIILRRNRRKPRRPQQRIHQRAILRPQPRRLFLQQHHIPRPQPPRKPTHNRLPHAQHSIHPSKWRRLQPVDFSRLQSQVPGNQPHRLKPAPPNSINHDSRKEPTHATVSRIMIFYQRRLPHWHPPGQ